jgi:Site-specific recombinases, DNA invertase Pin homologs
MRKKENNISSQEEIMSKLGVEKVYTDLLGGSGSARPNLADMMNFVRSDDTVITESISSFATNIKDLLKLMRQMKEKQVRFISLKEKIDTQTPTGEYLVSIFLSLDQLEQNFVKQRQQEGIQLAMLKGNFKGRPKKPLFEFQSIYGQWKAKKITAHKASEMLGVAPSTFYRKVTEYENSQQSLIFDVISERGIKR